METGRGNIELTEGISLVSNEVEREADQADSRGRSLGDVDDSYRSLPATSEAREQRVDLLLMERIANFLASHTLQFKMPKDSIQDMQRALEESK